MHVPPHHNLCSSRVCCSHLAALLGRAHMGSVYAFDVSERRLQTLIKRVRGAGADCITAVAMVKPLCDATCCRAVLMALLASVGWWTGGCRTF